VSQYEKSTTILYSLRAYSTADFVLKKIPNIYRFKEVDKTGRWTEQTAGGCPNNRDTFRLNPVYQFDLKGSSRDEDNDLMIELRGPKGFAVGLELTPVTLINQGSVNAFSKKDSGSYRNGFTYLRVRNIPAGTYNVTPATFNPGQLGGFFLTVNCTHALSSLRRIK